MNDACLEHDQSLNTAINKLLNVMTTLRDPINGCEWDRVQTFESIIPHTLDETYEVIDAIERANFVDLKAELGDLLYQIIFYSELARENELFEFNDVVDSITDKLINRHPDVFSEYSSVIKTTSQSVSRKEQNWEQIKQQERANKSQYSVLDDIPQSLPALLKAQKTQKRVASVGLDFEHWQDAYAKITEELNEVKDELVEKPLDKQKLENEIGDLLFSIVNLSRKLNLNAEICLNRATKKFEHRVRSIEKRLALKNQKINECDEKSWIYYGKKRKKMNLNRR